MHGSISITNIWLRGMLKKKGEDNLDFERTKTDSYIRIHEWRMLFIYLFFSYTSLKYKHLVLCEIQFGQRHGELLEVNCF